MTEQEIFLAAVEMTDLQRRDRYLEQACAGNLELRRRVEALLKAHVAADEFLSTPAVQQMSPKSTAIDGDKASPAEAAEQEQTQCFGHESVPGEDNVSLGFLTPSDQPGSLGRLGHYEVHEVLGHGAFGIVLKAFDEKLHRLVAIKVLSPELAATSPPRKRFLREARAAAAIRHEHVVSVYAVEEQPIPYLVMEYIPGLTLHQALNEHGPLDVADVLRLGQQIAEGLAAAHARGLIHRDIKPTNILLENGLSGHVKITDFGLARAADDASQTQSGTIAGTPMYMSPEQATTGQIDQRSDLFSLGSVLYVMASGRPPFRAANTLAVLKRVVEDMPRPIGEIIADTPDWLCAIIAKLQAKKPEERFGTAQEVADLLGRCLADLQANRPVVLPAGVQKDVEQYVETAEPVNRRSASDMSRVKTFSAQRAWSTIAAATLMLLAGLGFTEATGVTQLTSTVIRLTTGSGTLLIETDDPGVKVTIDGEEVQIQGAGVEQLTLKPGQYKVAAVKDGEPVSQQLVTITRGGKEVVKVSLERQMPLSAWGTFIDPLNDCVLRPTSAGISLTVPGNALHDLNPSDEWNNFNAPRLLQTVEGDFILQVKVLPFPPSQPGTAVRKGFSYRSAGLLVWDDGGTLLRHERASAGEIKDGKPHLQSEWFDAGEQVDLNYVPVVDGPIYLQIERHYDRLSLRWSDDGKVWHNSEDVDDLPLSPRVQIGVLAINATSTPLEAVFEDLQIQSPSRRTPAPRNEFAEPADSDRRAAEWVLSLGGTISIRSSAEERTIQPTQKLPTEPFRLTQVTLDHNERLKNAGLSPLKDLTNLITLRLDGSPLTDTDLSPLASLGNLAHLNLQATGVTSDGIEYLKDLGKLELLAIHDNPQLGNDALKYLVRMSELKRLDLRGTQVGDAGLQFLKQLPNLFEIVLIQTQVSDRGLETLSKFSKLSVLQLQNTMVTDAGLGHLMKIPTLRFLLLNGTKVTESGVKKLANALPDCRIEWDGGVIEAREGTPSAPDAPEPKLLTKAERGALQWAVDHGGRLWTTLGQATRVEDLPIDQAVGISGTQARLQILSLNLQGLELTDEAVDRLVALPPVGHLEIMQCSVSDAGLKRMLMAPLGQTAHALVLRDLPITRDGLEAVRTMRRLKFIQLSPGTLVDLATLRDWKQLPLIRLEIVKGQFRTEDFEAVAGMRNLDWLQLSRLGIDDAGLRQLLALTQLTQLSVDRADGPTISDAGLMDIGKLQKLTVLDLRNHSVTDEGIQALANCPKLERLLLAGTKGTEAGIQQLAAKLPRCRIEWDGGVIEPREPNKPDRTAAAWALSVGIPVDIATGNDLRTVQPGSDLPHEPFELRYADLRNPAVTDEGLAHFAGCRNIVSLQLDGKAITDAGVAHFKDCEQLTALSLERTAVTDAGLAHFAGCHDITQLTLNGSPVSDTGLAAFRMCLELRWLHLGQTQVTDAGLAHFQDCIHLEQLGLGQTAVTDAGLAHFKNCRNLTHLDLYQVQGVSDAGMEHFRRCRELTGLILDGTKISDAGLANFRDCRRLDRLSLDHLSVTDAGLAHFANCADLRTLSLHSTKITDAGLAPFAKCSKLWTLFLENTAVTDAGLRHFQDCEQLTLIGLARTGVSDAGLSSLRKSKSLQQLNLAETRVGDAGLPALDACRELTYINLARTPVTNAGLASLNSLQKLTELNLQETAVTDAGLDALKPLKNLTLLNLRKTNVSGAGVESLQQALPKCKIEW